MRIGAFGLLLFFVSLNVSLFLINESGILPNYERISPYTEPEGIQTQLLSVDLSGTSLAIGGLALTLSLILGYAIGNLVFGGTLGILLLGITVFFPALSWVVFGFPKLLALMGVPWYIWTALAALMSATWFWFISGFLAQRQLDVD